MSDSSESETSASSSKYDPLKALYSDNIKVPVGTAPLYDNVQQYEASLVSRNVILPVGERELVRKREEQKEKERTDRERALEERNMQRFAQYQGMVPTRERKFTNVLTRMESAIGPLATLRECVDKRLRIKVITRHGHGIRGVLHATLAAFDKQWNLALTDVLEVWKRRGLKKRKIPPNLGIPVPKGSAAALSPVPEVTETPLGGGVWECTRHMPQMMVRGEHVVLINVVER